MLAARVIAAVENPADVCVISPGPSVSVPFSSLQLPPEPLLLLEGSPLVLSLTRSKKLSVSHVCCLSPTHALIISPSLSHPTSTFQSLPSATLTPQPGSSTLSSQTCTSSVTKTKSKRTKKLPRRQPRKKPKQPHRTGLLRQHQATGTTSQRSAQKLQQQLLVPREPPEPPPLRELKPARSTTGQLRAPRPRRKPETGARTSRAAGNQWQPSDSPLDFVEIL